ncbi:MAG: hypothetical protein OEY19_05180, partial [Gammaproteobacteria bacterium]|nr:hypothetical protein [Gammaproteobacteria bacterium]
IALILIVDILYIFPLRKYESYDDLMQIEGILESGRIPKWIPKSATDIKESHGFDNGDGWLAP